MIVEQIPYKREYELKLHVHVFGWSIINIAWMLLIYKINTEFGGIKHDLVSMAFLEGILSLSYM